MGEEGGIVWEGGCSHGFPETGMRRGKDMATGLLSLPFFLLYPHQVTHVFGSGQTHSLCHPVECTDQGAHSSFSEEGVCFELRRQLTDQTWFPETLSQKVPVPKERELPEKGEQRVAKSFRILGRMKHPSCILQPVRFGVLSGRGF